jgi:hypothetical protein
MCIQEDKILHRDVSKGNVLVGNTDFEAMQASDTGVATSHDGSAEGGGSEKAPRNMCFCSALHLLDRTYVYSKLLGAM